MANIQVGIKIRPLIQAEKAKNLKPQWTVQNNCIFQVDDTGQRQGEPHAFDYIFTHDKTNKNLYDNIVRDFVLSTLSGLNSTIFAYGQTCSGKTYTMLGGETESGVMVLAIEDIFHSIRSCINRKYLVRMSYIEIYNEKIRDLLDPVQKDIKIRENYYGTLILQDVKEEIVTTTGQVMELLAVGNRNRHIGSTHMNERSSRSHTILRIFIESTMCGEEKSGAVQISCLNLVDLAGSERALQTKATGVRLKEGSMINKSLSTLALVIRQLSDGNEFKNFRDSKLTRLLQDSLGGNAKTLIIATITLTSVEDTQSTLLFAQRAKAVKNKPIINEIVSDQEKSKRYAQLNKNLQTELEQRLEVIRKYEQSQEMCKKEIVNLQEQLQALKTFQSDKFDVGVSASVQKRRQTIGVTREKQKTFQTTFEASSCASDSLMTSLLPFNDLSQVFTTPRKTNLSRISEEFFEEDTPKASLRCTISELKKELNQLTEYTRLEETVLKHGDKEIEKMKEENNKVKAENEKHVKQIKQLEERLIESEANCNKMKKALEKQNAIQYEEELINEMWKQKYNMREKELLDKIANLQSDSNTPNNFPAELNNEIIHQLYQLQDLLYVEEQEANISINHQKLNDNLSITQQLIRDEIEKQISKFDQFDDWLEDASKTSDMIRNFHQIINDFQALDEANQFDGEKMCQVEDAKFLVRIHECLLKIYDRFLIFKEKSNYDKNLSKSLKLDHVEMQEKLHKSEQLNQTLNDKVNKLKTISEQLEMKLFKVTTYYENKQKENGEEQEDSVNLSNTSERHDKSCGTETDLFDLSPNSSLIDDASNYLIDVSNIVVDNQIDSLTKENTEKHTQLVAFRQKIREQKKQIGQKTLQIIRQENAKLKAEVKKLNEQIAKHLNVINKYDMEMEELKVNNQNANKSIKDYLNQIARHEQVMVNLKEEYLKEIKQWEDKLGRVNCELNEKKEQMEKYQCERNEIESNLRNEINLLSETDKVRDELIEEMEKKHQEALKEQEEEINNLKRKLKDLEEEKATIQAIIQNSISNGNTNVNNVKEAQTNSDVEKLLTKENADLKSTLKFKNKLIADLRKKLNNNSKSEDVDNEEDKKLHAEIERLNNELKVKLIERDEIDVKFKNEIVNLEQIISSKNELIEQCKNAQIVATETIEKCQVEVNKLEKEIDDYKTKLSESCWENQQNLQIIFDLKTSVANFQKTILDQQIEIESLNSNLNEAGKKFNENQLKDEYNECKEKYTNLERQYEDVLKKYEAICENAQVLATETMEKHQVEVDKLKKEIDDYKTKLNESCCENQQNLQLISHLKKSISDQQIEIENLQSMLNKEREKFNENQMKDEKYKSLEDQYEDVLRKYETICEDFATEINYFNKNKVKPCAAMDQLQNAQTTMEQELNKTKLLLNRSMNECTKLIEEKSMLNRQISTNMDEIVKLQLEVFAKKDLNESTNKSMSLFRNKQDMEIQCNLLTSNQLVIEDELKSKITEFHNYKLKCVSEKEQLKENERKLVNKLSNCEHDLKLAKEQIISLDRQLKNSKVEYDVCKAKLVEMMKSGSKCDSCLKLIEEKKMLNKEISKHMDEIVKLQLQVYKHNAEEDKKLEQLKFYQMEEKTYREEIERLKMKLNPSKKKSNVEVQCNIIQSSVSFIELDTKYQKMKQLCRLRNSHNVELQEKLDKLREENEKLTNEISKKLAEIEDLKKEKLNINGNQESKKYKEEIQRLETKLKAITVEKKHVEVQCNILEASANFIELDAKYQRLKQYCLRLKERLSEK